MQGSQIDGRFDVDRQIGEGGMGVVYSARDRLTGQKVAIKVIQGGGAVDSHRFEREAKILSQLAHPGVVRYVAHGETRGRPYLAMEWLEGETLETRLLRGPLGVRECLALGIRVAEALSEAHRNDVIHRDLKPANLFLVGGQVERAKVLDFGVARWRWDARALTATGAAIGTALYMSPEQAIARPDLDARSDLFSLAAVLHECLTCRPVFMASNLVAVLAKIMTEPAALLGTVRPDAPQGLEQLLDRMLAKSAADRPESAASVRSELQTLLAARGEPGASEELTAALTEAASVRAARSSARSTAELRIMSIVLVKPDRPVLDGIGAGSTLIVNDVHHESRPVATGEQTAEYTFLGDLRAAVAPHEGRVDALIDGSLLVTSSTNRAPKEQAVHAARCALSLQRKLGNVPIAIGTGKAMVLSHSPVGAVIDTCARMLDGGMPGGIWVDAGTASLLGGRFEIHQEQAGNRLVAEQEAESSERLLLGKRVPCVGRDRDLDALAAYFRECVDESVSRVVLVTGPPGQGKTRLLQELLVRLGGTSPFLRLIASGDVARTGSPFGMLGPALRAAGGVQHGSALDVQRDRMRSFFGRHLEGGAADRVSAFLGEIAGVSFDEGGVPTLAAARKEPRVMADQLRIAWLDWLEAECAAGPVLLVLEDMHWADLASVGFVDAALRAVRDKPLMVLGLARPQVHDRFPELFRAHNLATMQLAALSRKASERLVQEALGDRLSPAARAALAERADGNPFFLEELVRAVDAGAMGAGSTELPVTVLGMVHARLDALSEDARDVLRAASVFGAEFSTEGTCAVLGDRPAAANVEAWIDLLLEREIIHEQRRDAARRVYTFRHALVRDAAYELLTDADRAVCHRLAGEWLEGSSEKQAAVVADHFEKGGALERAAFWYREAATQALQRSDMVGAVSCATRGIRCGATGELLGDLAAIKADALVWRREFQEGIAPGLEAMRLLEPGSARWLRVGGVLVSAYVGSAHVAEAEGTALRMHEVCEQTPCTAASAVGLAIAAYALCPTDRHDLVERVVAFVERMFSPLGAHPELAPWTYMTRAWRASIGGDLAEALRLNELAAQFFRDTGDARGLGLALGNMGGYLNDLGAFARAGAASIESQALVDRLGMTTSFLGKTSFDRGFAAFCLGRFDEAEGLFRTSLEYPDGTDAEGYARSYLARVLARRGRYEEALAQARAAAEVVHVRSAVKPVVLAALASTSSAAGLAEEALVHSTAAVRTLEETGFAIDETFVRLVHAEALHRAGRLDEAKAAVKMARDQSLSRAEAITDPVLRSSFQENVPDNARVLELARAWGV
jgi:tetratricopeptide (TPR) repeat protein